MQEFVEYRLEQERLEQEKEQATLEYINHHRSTQLANIPPVNALSDVDRLLLAATVESLGSENLKTTISLCDNFSLPLSPFFKLDEQILEHLFKANLLILTPKESYEYVTFDQNKSLEVDYHQASFEFTFGIEDLTKVAVSAKVKKNISTLVTNIQFESWCQQIQLGECISYLITRSRLNDLAPPIGEKMIILLRACLAEYSVSIMHYIIWKAVESAAAYVQKPNITRKHASNSIIGNIERVFGKISTGSWQHNESYRDSSHPQSAVSKVFFDYVFAIEDCGFNHNLDELFNPYRPQQAIGQVGYATLGSAQSTSYSITINDLK